MTVLVFNGWAAGPETWQLCSFRHDWIFSYVEQLDGLHHQVLDDAEDVIMVGFSMGGAMALKSLLKYSCKVRGLVLVSATPRMMEQKSEGWVGMSERRLNALKEGTNLVYGNDPSLLFEEKNLARGLEFLHDTDLRSALEEMPKTSFPVEIIQAERDGIVRPGNAEFLKRIFPQAKLTMVPGSEHVLPVKVPELIDQAVERVVKSAKR